MKKTASRCLAATLAFLLGIDTAAACRWMQSGGPSCTPAPVRVVPSCHPCCPPVDPCGMASPCGVAAYAPVDSGCGCGSGSVVHGTVSHGAVMESTAVGPTAYGMHESTAAPTLATPPEPTYVPESAPVPEAFGNGFRSDNATAQSPAPDEAWDAGLDSPEDAAGGFAAEEAAFTPEELPPAEPAPMPPTEVAAPTEDDLFASEPEVEAMPADEVEDDLFGGDDFGGEEAFGEEADAGDDLFGAEPAVEEMPAEMPVKETEDDLFGGDDFGGDEAFGEEADAGDDLFGAEPAPEEMPAEMPAEETEDDLFGGDDFGSDDAFGEEAGAADDLFGAEPAAEEMPAEMPAEEAEDDLFGGDDFGSDDAFGEEADAADDLFGSEPAAEEMPAEQAPAAEEDEGDLFDFGDDAGDDLFDVGPGDEADASDAEADLFDLGRVLGEPGGVQSSQDRTWVDNTGRYSTVGRLLAVDGSAIRLAKPAGGTATVPLARLSQRDLEFVSRQAMAMSEFRDEAIARGTQPEADAPKQAKAADPVAPLRTAQL